MGGKISGRENIKVERSFILCLGRGDYVSHLYGDTSGPYLQCRYAANVAYCASATTEEEFKQAYNELTSGHENLPHGCTGGLDCINRTAGTGQFCKHSLTAWRGTAMEEVSSNLKGGSDYKTWKKRDDSFDKSEKTSSATRVPAMFTRLIARARNLRR